MDLQQLIRNSTSDSVDQVEEQSNYSSNNDTAVDDSNNESLEKIGCVLSPNTKINIMKKKYHPSEMEEINEESIESDLTSSIISKRLL